MRRLLPWAIAALAIWVTDIVVLAATGRTESGEDNDALQISGLMGLPALPGRAARPGNRRARPVA